MFIPDEFRPYLQVLLAVTPSRDNTSSVLDFVRALRDIGYDELVLHGCLASAEHKTYQHTKDVEDRTKIR